MRHIIQYNYDTVQEHDSCKTMLRQVRSAVFESNSSSSHSLTLGTGCLVSAPFSPQELRAGEVELAVGDYGWEWHRYCTAKAKLNYLLTQLTDGKGADSAQALRESCEEFAILEQVVREHTGCALRVSKGEGGIDHQSARSEAAVGMELFNDAQALKAFLFDESACIQTGNDNDSPPWMIDSDLGPQRMFEQYLAPAHSGIPEGYVPRRLNYIRAGRLYGVFTGAGGWLPLTSDNLPALWEEIAKTAIVSSAVALERGSSDHPPQCARGHAATELLRALGVAQPRPVLLLGFEGKWAHENSEGFETELQFVAFLPAEVARRLDALDSKGYRHARIEALLQELREAEKDLKAARAGARSGTRRGSGNGAWHLARVGRVQQKLANLGVSKAAAAQREREARSGVLTLAVKKEFFDQISAGTKRDEFRLANAFWAKRLEGKTFKKLVITLGYPSADDASRRLEFDWNGYERRMHQHPLFGPAPVEVFAISLARPGRPANSEQAE